MTKKRKKLEKMKKKLKAKKGQTSQKGIIKNYTVMWPEHSTQKEKKSRKLRFQPNYQFTKPYIVDG